MITKYHGRHYKAQTLGEKSQIRREGVSMLGISEAAEVIDFNSLGVKITLEKLTEKSPLPCVLHWGQNHFVVFYNVGCRQGCACTYIGVAGSPVSVIRSWILMILPLVFAVRLQKWRKSQVASCNALDANNEAVFILNLEEFFQGRILVVVAHMLSTFKNADQTMVMEKGEILEIGTHADLVLSKGKYFEQAKR